jgi:cytochrome c oxidase assembly protein subunit 15
MSDSPTEAEAVPRWLHWWAVLTVLAALPLALFGAEVTTRGVGMADTEGFKLPWNLDLRTPIVGLFIEHSHRMAGFVVGICGIVLALGLLFGARRAGIVRWMGLLALVAICGQGLLGRYRVDRNARFGPELALVHGLFAQLVFALLVSVAVVTSRTWRRPFDRAEPRPKRGLALALPFLVYLQIVFGAIVRHLFDHNAQRAHLLFAFVVVAVVVLVVRSAWEGKDRAVRRTATLLAVLVAVQLGLGVEAWLGRFGAGLYPPLVPWTRALGVARSGHFIVGVLVFTTSVVLALLTVRPARATVTFPVLPKTSMEGAA